MSTTTQPQASSPWCKIEQPKINSLEDVINEQLAVKLHEDELNKLKIDESEYVFVEDENAVKTVEAVIPQQQSDDYMLASLLQLEFDKEYDELLKSQEKIRNKNSKVKMSYDNYKIVHPIIEQDEMARLKDVLTRQQEQLNDETSSSESDGDELSKITFKNGVHGKGENMISKHDLALTGKRNASRIMQFPPEFETGDGHNINMSLSNNVYNTLKVHSIHEEKRYNRLHDKQEKATTELALDSKTRLILYKLVNADILESVGGVISTGKEATVLHATSGKTTDMELPKECCAKVYKTTLNEFRTRSKYIKDDYRFKDRYKHLNPRKIVRLWAEKEMHNLIKIRRAEILCPDVVVLKKNVLVMSFIGVDGTPAPKLKEAKLNETELQTAYKQCVQILKDLYNKCNLVHADFSEYNLLWFENNVWVIDVSQSIENIDTMSLEFLYRDCKNVSKFFTNKNVDNVLSPEALFNEVTEKNFSGEGFEFVSQIQTYIKNKQIEIAPSKNDKAYNFDYYFEKSLTIKDKSLVDDDKDEDSSSDE